MVSIRRLDVASFRGIPQLAASLIFDQKSVLLFGENGTGKMEQPLSVPFHRFL